MNHSKQKKLYPGFLASLFMFFSVSNGFHMNLQMFPNHVHEKLVSRCSFVFSKRSALTTKNFTTPTTQPILLGQNMFFVSDWLRALKLSILAIIDVSGWQIIVLQYILIYSFPKTIMEQILDRELFFFQDWKMQKRRNILELLPISKRKTPCQNS